MWSCVLSVKWNTFYHQVAIPHMAEVLTEIFTGSLEIALKVKEEQVERIFQLISNGKAQVELIATLQAMAKVHVCTCTCTNTHTITCRVQGHSQPFRKGGAENLHYAHENFELEAMPNN